MATIPKFIDPRLIDELLYGCQSQEDLLGQDGLIHQHTESIVEGALQGELTHQRGYDKHVPEDNRL